MAVYAAQVPTHSFPAAMASAVLDWIPEDIATWRPGWVQSHVREAENW